jgi:heat-inducible transcriptional repressor
MNSEEGLSVREREILCSIVRAYIETGEAVGSRTLSKQRHDPLSPASIRNTMADLADAGYLAQPHTSAGRVPTEKAFRVFVRSLPIRPPSALHRERILSRFHDAGSVQDRAECSSRILSELCRAVGIAAALPAASLELDQVEFLPLSDHRILMVCITRDQQVHNRVVHLDQDLTTDDLASIRNYINWNFSGWRLPDIRRELLRRIGEERDAYDEILQRVNLLYHKGLLDVERNTHLHMDGASHLVGLDLHLTKEKLRDLFRALEEKQRMLEILDRFLEQSNGQLGVFVGLEEAHPAMKELSLIGVTVALPGGLAGRVAVLGPMRMDYERVISTVQQISAVFAAF